MIRRLLVVAALTLAAGGAAAAPATAAPAPAPSVRAANGNIICLWNVQPLNVGYCLGI